MKRNCPNCRFHWAWKLKDGRFKCRRCGKRYTFRSVWQASRIAERTKRNLVQGFGENEPNAPVVGIGAAQKRFLRLIRMTIAYREHYGAPFTAGDPHSDALNHKIDAHPSMMVLGLHRNQRIRVFPVFGSDAEHLVNLVHTQNNEGVLYYTAERHAFGLLTVENNLIVPQGNEIETSEFDHMDDFWRELNRWLAAYPRVPVEELHLFIGEISFRFHHRPRNLSQLILKWIQETPYHVIKHM